MINGKEVPDVLLLSYLGDAVLEEIIREYLIGQKGATPHSCSSDALMFVTAPRQAEAAKKLAEFFTEEETEIFRHGKNAKTNSVPRNTTVYTYRVATGLEAVFGYNKLNGLDARNRELFSIGYLTQKSE